MKSEGNSRSFRGGHLPKRFSHKIIQVMKISLFIPDADYASLLKGTRRLRGSIGLLSPTEGTFNLHAETGRSVRDYRKLPHGRVSLGTENLRLTLNVDLNEHGIRPAQVLIDESEMASRYANGLITENENVKTENYEAKRVKNDKSVFRFPFSDFTLANGGEL